MISSNETDKIIPAFVTALAALKDIRRGRTAKIPTKTGGEYSYKFADLHDALGYLRPILATHELAVSQTALTDDKGTAVATTLFHSSGQWIETPPLRLPAGADAQSHGSSITFARRYSLLAFLGLATEDDDGRAAVASDSRPTAAPPPKPSAPTSDEPATDAQVKKIGIVCQRLGITDDSRVEHVAGIVGRPLTSTKELTRAEASQVIDALDGAK